VKLANRLFWSTTSLFEQLRHGYRPLDGVSKPFAHGLACGHARSRGQTLECSLNLWRDWDSDPDWLLLREQLFLRG
jgi:hypothetical protein